MRLIYFRPERNSADQNWETEAQARPNTEYDTLQALEGKLRAELPVVTAEPIILVMCAHGYAGTGNVGYTHGPLTADDFSYGLMPPTSGIPTGTVVVPAWSGLVKLLKGLHKETRFYFLAAQCYGLYFAKKMPHMDNPNVFILGLSSAATNPAGDGMTTVHLETEAHVVFIEQIEDRFMAMRKSEDAEPSL